jgi:hypothetical protein
MLIILISKYEDQFVDEKGRILVKNHISYCEACKNVYIASIPAPPEEKAA